MYLESNKRGYSSISNLNQKMPKPCPNQYFLNSPSHYEGSRCPSQCSRNHLFCCSNTTKVTTVCGQSRIKLGVHPLNKNLSPSVLRAVTRIFTAPPSSFPFAFIIRVLNTSIGELLQNQQRIKAGKRTWSSQRTQLEN
jgi:hypothetical protein